MQVSMTTNEIPSTLGDMMIIGVVVFYNKIYGFLLLMTTHEVFRELMIDLKDVFGAIVGMLGTYLMILKILKSRKQNKETVIK